MRGSSAPQTLVLKHSDFVIAAKSLGFRHARIMFRHILPNAIVASIVFSMSDVVLVILSGAAVSYLGLGVQPPTAEWGIMVAEGQNFITTAWWITTFPGLAIVVLAFGFSMLADGLGELLGAANERLLDVDGLSVEAVRDGAARSLSTVSFALGRGEMLGLVGESGSGKTVTCRALMRLLPTASLAITGGRVMLEGNDITALSEKQMQQVRGRRIGMIFQNPASHLDPVMSIGKQIAESLGSMKG